MHRYFLARLFLADGMARAPTEHKAILIACDVGNSDLSVKLTYEHVKGVKASLLGYLKPKRKRTSRPRLMRL